MLALRGGGELVALWAQLATVIDLVAGVVGAGVATGLAVYVARTRRAERQLDLFREALRLGLATTLPVALILALAGLAFPDALGGDRLSPAWIAAAAACGWLAVIPSLINNLWLGQQRRGLMLAMALGTAALTLAVALLAPPGAVLPLLVLAQALPALLVLFVLRGGAARPRFRFLSHPLRRYVLPGLSIGVFSAGSTLVARSVVGESLSWHDAGVLQALWRITDWIGALAGGILSVIFLPRFAALRGTPQLALELRKAAAMTVLPSAAVLGACWLAREPLLAALYDPLFHASAAAAGWTFLGSVLRVASWIPLFALYAMRRTKAITVGELLSLPLFAALVLLNREGLTLEHVGIYWTIAYAAYLAFNIWAARRT